MKKVAGEPYQMAEIPGPKKAMLLPGFKVLFGMIEKAKRPLMIVGHEVAEKYLGGRAIDYIVELAKRFDLPVVATANLIKEFRDRGYEKAYEMSAMEIGSRLVDERWDGIDGKGCHDLVIFIGIPYYMEWVILSGLKHSAPWLKTVSIDPYYQPHATWSMPNMAEEEWEEAIKLVLKG